jgi:hypothetical protein
VMAQLAELATIALVKPKKPPSSRWRIIQLRRNFHV